MTFWDFRAFFYDRTRKVFPINLIFKVETQNITLLLSSINKKEATVLDVASGTGAIIPLLSTNWKTLRIDSSFSMLKKASKKHSAVVADCNRLPFKPASFDIITAVGLVEYLKNPHSLFKHFQNVSKSGAKVIFTFAQFNCLNILRNLLGHRVYTHESKKIEQIYNQTGFIKEVQRKSLLQTQVLLKKV